MAVEISKYVVFTSPKNGRRQSGGWKEVLDRWYVQCPQCTEGWLAPGVKENDLHTCKGCGYEFVKRSATNENELNM